MTNQVYTKTSETLKIEKQLLNYIRATKNKLPLEKKVSQKLFDTLINATPKNDREHYRAHGIPFVVDEITYTIKSA